MSSQDLYEVGGVPAVMKYLLANGFLHGDRITCTGKTVAENLADFADLTPGQKVIMPLENPKRADGPLIILTGTLHQTVRLLKYQVLKCVVTLDQLSI